MSQFLKILDSCKGIHIAVIGDLMLDRYLVGKIERISPEAPVPIVDIHEEFVLPETRNITINIYDRMLLATCFRGLIQVYYSHIRLVKHIR